MAPVFGSNDYSVPVAHTRITCVYTYYGLTSLTVFLQSLCNKNSARSQGIMPMATFCQSPPQYVAISHRTPRDAAISRWRRNTRIWQKSITVGHKRSASLTGQGWHEDSANSHCSRAIEKFCYFLLEKVQTNSNSVILTGGDRTRTFGQFPLENDPETFNKFSLEKDHGLHQVSLEKGHKEDSQRPL